MSKGLRCAPCSRQRMELPTTVRVTFLPPGAVLTKPTCEQYPVASFILLRYLWARSSLQPHPVLKQWL